MPNKQARETIDQIVSVIKTLSPGDQDEIKRQLEMLPPVQSKCEQGEHQFKYIGRVAMWFRPAADKFFCQRCGQVKYIRR